MYITVHGWLYAPPPHLSGVADSPLSPLSADGGQSCSAPWCRMYFRASAMACFHSCTARETSVFLFPPHPLDSSRLRDEYPPGGVNSSLSRDGYIPVRRGLVAARRRDKRQPRDSSEVPQRAPQFFISNRRHVSPISHTFISNRRHVSPIPHIFISNRRHVSPIAYSFISNRRHVSPIAYTFISNRRHVSPITYTFISNW